MIDDESRKLGFTRESCNGSGVFTVFADGAFRCSRLWGFFSSIVAEPPGFEVVRRGGGRRIREGEGVSLLSFLFILFLFVIYSLRLLLWRWFWIRETRSGSEEEFFCAGRVDVSQEGEREDPLFLIESFGVWS